MSTQRAEYTTLLQARIWTNYRMHCSKADKYLMLLTLSEFLLLLFLSTLVKSMSRYCLTLTSITGTVDLNNSLNVNYIVMFIC